MSAVEGHTGNRTSGPSGQLLNRSDILSQVKLPGRFCLRRVAGSENDAYETRSFKVEVLSTAMIDWKELSRPPSQMAASASKTLSICQRRTPIAVQPASNCNIALRARRMASGYGATGPQPVKIVRLNRSAQQDQSGGFHDGSMSICSTLCSSALMQTHKPCACVARRSSIRSAR